jgi:myosin heavy subunit
MSNFYCWVPDDTEVYAKVVVRLCDGKAVSKFNFTNSKTIHTDIPPTLQSNLLDPSFLNKNSNTKIPNQNNYIEWDIQEVLKYHTSHESYISNIASITDLNNAALLSIIKSRFHKDLIYTQINTIIICLNPYKSIPNLYNTEVYSKLSKSEQEAHLFYVCYRAKKLLSKSNQSIVVTGESGAGKTETCRQILNFFLNDIHGKLNIKIQRSINACPPIIESLGNAWTISNLNSSRFGKFSRIMMQKMFVVGMEIEYYLLERNRIISQTSGERNYHVFYQMIQGLEKDQANRLCLDENFSYRYFTNGFIKTKNDKFYFKIFRDGLENIFSKEETINIMEILATILNIGNLNFIDVIENNDDTCVKIEEDITFDFVAKTLGTDHLQENIRHLLTSKRFKSGSRSSTTMIMYTKDNSILTADSLAKDIYEKLFAYIIKKCNEINVSSENAKFVGILDIFGFEIYNSNSFEQLCINYCNEKMQQLFNDIIFEEEKKQFILEGLPSDLIKYKGNEDIIALIDSVFSLVDAQCSLGRVYQVDDDGRAIYNQIQANYAGKNSHLKVNKSLSKEGSRKFTVFHFAGAAEYSIAQFISKNIDKIDIDLYNLLSTSSNSILANMYEHVIKEEQHELSRKQKSIVDGIIIPSRKKAPLKTVASKFRLNLDNLIINLKKNSLHFIKCINTNNLKLENNFNSKLVFNQMMHSGIFEVRRMIYIYYIQFLYLYFIFFNLDC